MEISQSEILLISYAVGAVCFVVVVLIAIVGYFGKNMHSQAMKKFDSLIDSVQKLATQTALQDEKLLTGSKEFIKISEHQKTQDDKIDLLAERSLIHEHKIAALEIQSQQ